VYRLMKAVNSVKCSTLQVMFSVCSYWSGLSVLKQLNCYDCWRVNVVLWVACSFWWVPRQRRRTLKIEWWIVRFFRRTIFGMFRMSVGRQYFSASFIALDVCAAKSVPGVIWICIVEDFARPLAWYAYVFKWFSQVIGIVWICIAEDLVVQW